LNATAAGGQFVNFETVSPKWFATQMLLPSNATPFGPEPTANVPRTVPSLARSLVTLLLPAFVTQMLLPSNATPYGLVPTTNVP
jgi:hypothetical protein